jgi:hypothetical protein
VPSDTDLLQTYSFYLKVEASGDYTYSEYFGPYTLIVGCSTDPLQTVMAYTGLINGATIAKNTVVGSINTYTFPAWSTTPSDCGVSGYEFTFDNEVTFEAATFDTGVAKYPSVTCSTTPCLAMDVNIETA